MQYSISDITLMNTIHNSKRITIILRHMATRTYAHQFNKHAFSALSFRMSIAGTMVTASYCQSKLKVNLKRFDPYQELRKIFWGLWLDKPSEVVIRSNYDPWLKNDSKNVSSAVTFLATHMFNLSGIWSSAKTDPKTIHWDKVYLFIVLRIT